MVKKGKESLSYTINQWFEQHYQKQNCSVLWACEGAELTFESISCGPI